MASDDEDHTATIYADEQDLEEEEDDADDDLIDDEEQTHQIDDEENDDVELIDDDEDADVEADAEEDDEEEDAEEDDTISISSAGAGDVTVAGIPIICDTQTAATTTTVTTSTVTTLQQNNNSNSVITDSVTREIIKKPCVDDSRRLFQRLWTDEDEIELLQGFYEYITQRGFINSNHHHDTTAFYDQIKGKLQLDFNKNQLVEKLRRLKKKYRNVLSKISEGKEYVFKSPHDQATFDLSCKIWNESVSVCAVPVTAVADGGGGFDDEEMVNVDGNASVGFNLNENNGTEIGDFGSLEKKGSRSRKRSRSNPATVKVEENYDQKQQQYGQSVGMGVGAGVSNVVTPNVVEETVKSCLLPLFKELVNSSMNGARGLGSGIGGVNVGAFGGGSMGFQIGDMSDEKWRKQHILELEVYSKRLELMQDQVKSKLEELKSMVN